METATLTPEIILNHIDSISMDLVKPLLKPVPHKSLLKKLLQAISIIDFRKIAKLDEKEKISSSHFHIITVETLLDIAKNNNWGICRNHDFVYLYNGAYWSHFDTNEIKGFLGDSAEKMGVDKYRARFYKFRDELFKQFLALGHLAKPEPAKDTIFINLQNGTFEVSPTGTKMRSFDRADFLTYILPFPYNPKAKAPIFDRYINKVLPDIQSQKVLAEFLGYIFIHPSNLKLEKTLLLYGTGANGKSVFFDIVNALLGNENVSSYSLQSLTNDNGYFRAKLANKLVNYASEINGNLETAIFKQLVSGEPVEARLPYGDPFVLSNYAKLIFNVNELPKDVEHTTAYFRRFLIIPFTVTIPENEQDKELSKKIINNELAGVFNWILEGLNRLLLQRNFSNCEAALKQVEAYKRQSDSVHLFLDENKYLPDPEFYALIKDVYIEYRIFCSEDGFKPVNKVNFKKRLEAAGIATDRKETGNVAFLRKQNEPF